MLEVLDWQRAADPGALVRRAVEALRRGELVVFPTETVYGVAASAQSTTAIDRLCRGKDRPSDKPFTLAIGHWRQVLRWLPDLTPLGQRLARRSWPGPLTLVSGAGLDRGLLAKLPRSTQERISPAGTLGLRVPAHPAIEAVLRQLEGALVLTSANRGGEAPATTAEAAAAALGDDVSVVIDDGPCPLSEPSTVVEVMGERWKILREGALTSAEIKRRSGWMMVFVCTGNTCRSPIAEGLSKHLLAEQFGCTVDALPERGIGVVSAGLAAVPGGNAAAEAVAIAAEHGADLSAHRSQPLTPALVNWADQILGMTYAHVLAIQARYPDAADRVTLFSPEGDDIPDPIGCDEEIYRACAARIAQVVQQRWPRRDQ